MTFISDKYTVEVTGTDINSDELTRAILSVDGVDRCPIRLHEDENEHSNEPDIDSLEEQYNYTHSHGPVKVRTEGGKYISTTLCNITDEDINDDGTVSMPLSGECGCHEDDITELPPDLGEPEGTRFS